MCKDFIKYELYIKNIHTYSTPFRIIPDQEDLQGGLRNVALAMAIWDIAPGKLQEIDKKGTGRAIWSLLRLKRGRHSFGHLPGSASLHATIRHRDEPRRRVLLGGLGILLKT